MAATYQACGKFILLGEHFVVHGTPAVALPLHAVATSVTASRAEGILLDSTLDGPERALSDELVRLACQRLGVTGVHARVESTIPVGFGLGSSAAFCVSLVGALDRLYGLSLEPERRRAHAHALEQRVHGTPSGIDDTVISYGAPVRFQLGAPIRRVPVGRRVRLVLASCGYPGSTRDAVAGVRRQAEADPKGFATLRDRAAECVGVGLDALRDGELERLGAALDADQALLRAVGVSTAELDALVRAARGAGALGAKLTGGGLGGFVLALAAEHESAPEALAAALEAAGGHSIMITAVEPTDATPAAPSANTGPDGRGDAS